VTPASDRPLRFAIVGARRARQGTGVWVARELARLGHEVPAIVGTSPESVEKARVGLGKYGLAPRGYTSLETLLDREPVDAVFVGSPAEAHVPHVSVALERGRHVFCEKPFFWPMDEAALGRLVSLAESKNLLLALQTQWPCTLPFYFELWPEVKGQRVNSLAMKLGPVDTGPTAVME
jgi:predicted dehydrogenase